MTLAFKCSFAYLATVVSATKAARTPWFLSAAVEIPTPVPQSTTP